MIFPAIFFTIILFSLPYSESPLFCHSQNKGLFPILYGFTKTKYQTQQAVPNERDRTHN